MVPYGYIRCREEPRVVSWRVGQIVGQLTVAAVKSLAKRGLHGDGNTLYLKVAAGGSKSWVQRVTIRGRRHDIGLGSCARVPLAEARRRAAANLLLIAAGGDPLADRKRQRVPTFREVAHETWTGLQPTWRDGSRSGAIWWRSMERYVLPEIGHLPVSEISRQQVLKILTPIWTSRRVTAGKVRQRIRKTLALAQAHGHVDVNAAGEVIDGALPKMPAKVTHHRAPPYADVAAVLASVERSEAALATRLCFRFLVLTAARSGEARGAAWTEIDRELREWRIPGERMKAGKAHVVALTDSALRVLDAAEQLRDGSGLVFPSPARRGQPLSDNTLSKLLRDLGIDSVPHGFRAAFRTWAAERTDTPHAIMELALSHLVGDAVERAYNRSDLRRKRQRLMQRWSAFLEKDA